MKAVFSFFCSLAVAAGIFMGYLDYRKERRESEPGPVVRVEGGGWKATEEGAAEEGARKSLREPRKDREALPPEAGEGSSERPVSPSKDGGSREGEAARSGEVPSAGAGALTDELEALRRKIEAQEFAEAARYGEEILAEPSRGGAQDRTQLARLIAKAHVYERIVQALPESTAVSGGVSQVVLANGNTIEATKVDAAGDRYRIELARGGTFSPRKEDVLEVRAIDPESYMEKARERIQVKVEKANHPVDWFLDGVQEYYALGLPKQGLAVLDRILALDSDQSDQVPLLFVPDADDSLLREWQIAAGRRAPDLPAEVATSRAPGEPSAGAGGATEAASPTERASEEPSPPRESVASYRPPPSRFPSGSGSADANELVRCAQLFAEAQMLYQGSARQEGKEEDLEKARGRLDRAMEIIEGQPPDDETVRRLRRQIGQLLSDVARASPF